MKKMALLIALVALIAFAVLLWIPRADTPLLSSDPSELKPGGEGTVSIKPFPSLFLPAANLPQTMKPDFHAGKALAHQPWIKAPTITDARDGLGPIYNARTCLACHVNGGRGHMPDDEKQLLFTNFLRLSIPGTDPVKGVKPEPVYGDQLQSQSVALSHQLRTHKGMSKGAKDDPPPEGYVYIHWSESAFVYPDGQKVALRTPTIEIRQLGYGPLHPDTMMGIRNAPPIHGMGLLAMIDQADIDRLADPKDEDRDGISGRINVAWDFKHSKPAPGRFGLKANKVSVRAQVAGAFQGDMGISNPVFPEQPCTMKQPRCQKSIHGNAKDGLEINEALLTLVVNFSLNIGVPARRKPNHPMVKQGRELFYQVQCDTCHHPSYTTQISTDYPHLSKQHIWPYSDLLLHDMGNGLADGRPDYLATGSEWRTAPLWSVGLSKAVNGSANYLHDGRARTIEEAILWHSGEAKGTRAQFAQLQEDDRAALIAFVKSL